MGRVFDEEELYVKKKVMTDEQLEVLRRQISAYTTICEQLVQMHNSITTQQDHLAGMRLGNIYCNPLMTSSGPKIGTRQRWAPTPTQLQILESIFDQGSGTPGKQKVKEITSELSQHGPISETNVYNWFQNRRARSKRKQLVEVPNTLESEAEGEIESPKEKKSKAEKFEPNEKSATRGENVNVQSPELSDDLHCFDAQLIRGDSMFEIDCGLRFSEGFDHVALFESFPRSCKPPLLLMGLGFERCKQSLGKPGKDCVHLTHSNLTLWELLASGMDYLHDKMEVPEGFTHYQLGEEFDING